MTNEESLLWKIQTPNVECWMSKDLQTEGREKKKDEQRDGDRDFFFQVCLQATQQAIINYHRQVRIKNNIPSH